MRIVMKILKSAFWGGMLLAASSGALLAGGDGMMAAAYDHITTEHGKTYHSVSVVSADHVGLTFRHSGGIAKELFVNLHEDLAAEHQKEAPEQPEVVASNGTAAPGGLVHELTYTWVNFRQQQPQYYGHYPAQYYPGSCQPYHLPSIHALHHPVHRELHRRQFLYNTGILPDPCRPYYGRKRNRIIFR